MLKDIEVNLKVADLKVTWSDSNESDGDECEIQGSFLVKQESDSKSPPFQNPSEYPEPRSREINQKILDLTGKP